MTDHIVEDLAAIADGIDFPPTHLRLWPWPPRRVPVKIDTISAVMHAMRGSVAPLDQEDWSKIWRLSRARSVRAYTQLENDVRLVENQMGLTP